MTIPIDAPLALLGGVLTIASPCVLPVLPIILGGTGPDADRSRPLFIVAGFVLTFSAAGLLLAGASQHFATAHEVVRNVGLAMLALTGLAMLWKHPYAWLMNKAGELAGPLLPAGGSERAGKAGALVLGMSLGAVWTPCAGPVLASILVLVAKAQDVGWSATLLVLYAAGAALPMLAIAYGSGFVRSRIRSIARYTDRLQQGFGALILATALLIYFQYDVLLYARVADFVSL